jgi:hypothetical protein
MYMYQRYANITVWNFFVFSHVPHIGTRNSCYLRAYVLLVAHDLFSSLFELPSSKSGEQQKISIIATLQNI